MKRLLSLLAFVFASHLDAQAANVVAYGAGCGPTLSWTGLPRLGQSLTFVYSGPNSYFDVHGNTSSNQPVLLLGASDQQMGAVPLPLLLPSSITNGQPACFILQSTDIAMGMAFQMPPVPPVGFVSQAAVSIPNDAGLLGLSFFAQWLTWHRHRLTYGLPWTEWVYVSGGARATIGV